MLTYLAVGDAPYCDGALLAEVFMLLPEAAGAGVNEELLLQLPDVPVLSTGHGGHLRAQPEARIKIPARRMTIFDFM